MPAPVRVIPLLLALTVSCAGTSPAPKTIGGVREAPFSTEDRPSPIPVTSEPDLGRPHEALGRIEWPFHGMFRLFNVPCDEDRLRQIAREEFGPEVDAIVDYREWSDGGQVYCGGTAVHFR